uniref:Uncharacterized protein n=1 Tax=Populus trichocarpa TaxID=3694 RepID=A0A3N7ELC7_POPTR
MGSCYHILFCYSSTAHLCSLPSSSKPQTHWKQQLQDTSRNMITGKEGGITILQRIGTGIFLTIAAMLVSGLISRREARDYSSYQADSRKCTKKRCH